MRGRGDGGDGSDGYERLAGRPYGGKIAAFGECIWYAQGFSGHGVPTATMAGHLLAEAIDGDTTGFDLMASVPTHRFPGGTLLRWPGLVAGMLFYSLRDRLGR